MTKQNNDINARQTLPRIVACIPAYNEENNIGPIILRTLKNVDLVLVCDDGSNDLTGQLAATLGATVITHERNLGYGAAIRTLLEETYNLNADIIVTIDSDGQHNPDEIPKLISHLENGEYDIVIGSRYTEGGSSEAPPWREKGIELITNLVNNDSISDSQSGFRVYNRKSLEIMSLTENGMGLSTEILVKAKKLGLKISEVPITITYSDTSSTHNPLFHGIDVVLTTLKHLSMNNPLLFYGLPGLISTLISLLFWGWTIQVYAQTSSIITNVALIALGTTLVGLMLMTTGINLWVIISIIRENKYIKRG